jgi:secreted Zn-dependent insulinase-like peptidase
MTSYDVTPVRWFLEQLSPSSMNVFWSSRRHKGHTGSKEPFYGAHYTAEPLPPSWLDTFQAYAAVDASSTNQEQRQADAGRTSAAAPQQQQQQRDGVQQQFVPLPGELYLPPQNWAIPTDFELRPQEAHQPAGPDATTAAAAAAEAAGAAAAESAGGALQPDSVVQQPGLCVWHKLDTSYGLPKVCTAAWWLLVVPQLLQLTGRTHHCVPVHAVTLTLCWHHCCHNTYPAGCCIPPHLLDDSAKISSL